MDIDLSAATVIVAMLIAAADNDWFRPAVLLIALAGGIATVARQL